MVHTLTTTWVSSEELYTTPRQVIKQNLKSAKKLFYALPPVDKQPASESPWKLSFLLLLHHFWCICGISSFIVQQALNPRCQSKVDYSIVYSLQSMYSNTYSWDSRTTEEAQQSHIVEPEIATNASISHRLSSIQWFRSILECSASIEDLLR